MLCADCQCPTFGCGLLGSVRAKVEKWKQDYDARALSAILYYSTTSSLPVGGFDVFLLKIARRGCGKKEGERRAQIGHTSIRLGTCGAEIVVSLSPYLAVSVSDDPDNREIAAISHR